MLARDICVLMIIHPCPSCGKFVDVKKEAYHERKTASYIFRQHFKCSIAEMRRPVYLNDTQWKYVVENMIPSDAVTQDICHQLGWITSIL